MIVFCIICVVFASAIIGIIYSHDDYDRDGLNIASWFTTAVSALALLILACAYPYQRKEDKFLAKRNYIETQLRDTTISDYERRVLIYEAIQINDGILSEKIWSDSKWVGMFSSKRVGNAPLIELHR